MKKWHALQTCFAAMILHYRVTLGKLKREKDPREMMCEISDCKMVSYARLSLMRIKIGGRQFWAIANNKRCLLPIPPQLRQTSCVQCGFFEPFRMHWPNNSFRKTYPNLSPRSRDPYGVRSNVSSILDRESNIIEATRPFNICSLLGGRTSQDAPDSAL